MDNQQRATRRTNDPAANPDPITKAPGAHPLGAGIGAAAGGAAVGGAMTAGAIAGSAIGPVGTAAGAAIGAVVGGLIGKGVAEKINPSVEHEYWDQNYSSRPYVPAGTAYDQFGPAYQYGWEARAKHADKNFDEVEGTLRRDWNRAKGTSQLKWDQARLAARDAWDRVSSNRDDDNSDETSE